MSDTTRYCVRYTVKYDVQRIDWPGEESCDLSRNDSSRDPVQPAREMSREALACYVEKLEQKSTGLAFEERLFHAIIEQNFLATCLVLHRFTLSFIVKSK